jgi:hypothetical protein
MVRTFCTSGENEAVKGAVHAAGGVLAAVMAAYNITAWYYRRERHLGLNAVVYSLATMWEVRQTAHHIERWDPAHLPCAAPTPAEPPRRQAA